MVKPSDRSSALCDAIIQVDDQEQELWCAARLCPLTSTFYFATYSISPHSLVYIALLINIFKACFHLCFLTVTFAE